MEDIPKEKTSPELTPFEKLLQHALGKEAKYFPRLHAKVLLGSHGTAKDCLPAHLEIKSGWPDVIVPEIAGWKPETLESFRRIAFGQDIPEEYFLDRGLNPHAKKYDYDLEFFRAIYATHKFILFLDTPSFTDKMLRLGQGDRIAKFSFPDIRKGYKHVMAEAVRDFKKAALYHKRRMNYIQNHMARDLITFIKSTPKLIGKHDVNVIMLIGALHPEFSRGVVQLFGRKNTDVVIPGGTIDYPFSQRMNKNFERGRVDEEMVARALVEELLSFRLKKKLDDITDDRFLQIRSFKYLAAQFNKNEVLALFDDISSLEKRQWQGDYLKSDPWHKRLLFDRLHKALQVKFDFNISNEQDLIRLIKKLKQDYQDRRKTLFRNQSSRS